MQSRFWLGCCLDSSRGSRSEASTTNSSPHLLLDVGWAWSLWSLGYWHFEKLLCHGCGAGGGKRLLVPSTSSGEEICRCYLCFEHGYHWVGYEKSSAPPVLMELHYQEPLLISYCSRSSWDESKIDLELLRRIPDDGGEGSCAGL